MQKSILPQLPEEREEERCRCNRLLCITEGNIIEIKCNKCKRISEYTPQGLSSGKPWTVKVAL